MKTLIKALFCFVLVAAGLCLAGGLYAETHRAPDQP
jgi:hypothetical protein